MFFHERPDVEWEEFVQIRKPPTGSFFFFSFLSLFSKTLGEDLGGFLAETGLPAVPHADQHKTPLPMRGASRVGFGLNPTPLEADTEVTRQNVPVVRKRFLDTTPLRDDQSASHRCVDSHCHCDAVVAVAFHHDALLRTFRTRGRRREESEAVLQFLYHGARSGQVVMHGPDSVALFDPLVLHIHDLCHGLGGRKGRRTIGRLRHSCEQHCCSQEGVGHCGHVQSERLCVLSLSGHLLHQAFPQLPHSFHRSPPRPSPHIAPEFSKDVHKVSVSLKRILSHFHVHRHLSSSHGRPSEWV
mmetsp:Transcript_13057/g.25606  ORF Transcript_13057/g.25606 Transcript_13057/m.25606 type:complete len:299 (-) Transcript_13057:714-1610(-)